MKILILSDIHANWYALEAILANENYDTLIFLGDAVDFGPNPKECVRFLMDSSSGRFHGVRGDHDHALAYGINCVCSKELRELSSRTREWGEGFITGKEVGFLRRLPFNSRITLDGFNFYLAHGSPDDGLIEHCTEEYFAPMTQFGILYFRQMVSIAAVACVLSQKISSGQKGLKSRQVLRIWNPSQTLALISIPERYFGSRICPSFSRILPSRFAG